MPNIKYIARVLTGVRWKKLSHMLDVVHDKCGQSRVHTFFDILWCAARYGAGYYDYVMYGFYDLTARQRDTYLLTNSSSETAMPRSTSPFSVAFWISLR